LTLALLVTFLAAWLYTEVTEYFERDNFHKEVDTFIHQGGRFTDVDGYNLCVRIRHLETRHHGLDVPLCEMPKESILVTINANPINE
jgi:hypothetical protein